MKKLSLITGILTFGMVFAAVLGSVCGAVVSKAHDPLLYGSQSRAAVKDSMGFLAEDEVTAYIGLDWQQQDDLAGALANAMRLENASFEIEPLNEREQQHMRDVRDLILMAERISRTCMTLAVVLAVVTAWTGARLARRRLPRLIGGLGAVTLIAVIAVAVGGMISGGQFERLFVGMHEALFTNDLWLMDPKTDILIRMMPQLLFERALLDCVNQALRVFMIVWIMLIVVHAIVESMIRRHTTQAEDNV